MTNPETLLRDILAAFEAKDIERGMSMLAPDAVIIDPHYPQPEMRGRAAIMRGMRWALGSLEKPGFNVRRAWSVGSTAVAEVDTHHVIRGPIKQSFGQVFVAETSDGKITYLRSYPSYGPHGMGGLVLTLTRLVWRLRGRLR
jgi:ketosteroid isomerase-like protein